MRDPFTVRAELKLWLKQARWKADVRLRSSLLPGAATSTIWNWFGYRKSDAEQTTIITINKCSVSKPYVIHAIITRVLIARE
ncbi:MAG: hypothetical protein ACRCY0_04825, partial [Synechococcus elongatus]|uniref:hypothetical protein n=1 Tax=Synechococcus elongatus TaxID=32046 RepID=UPI003F3402B3